MHQSPQRDTRRRLPRYEIKVPRRAKVAAVIVDMPLLDEDEDQDEVSKGYKSYPIQNLSTCKTHGAVCLRNHT